MANDGTPSGKTEYPPLLGAGMHILTLADLRELCVGGFPLSSKRDALMTNLEAVIGKLERHGIPGEVWVDGSFLTEKIEPSDVDLVLRTTALFYDNAAPEQREAIEWVAPDLRETIAIDADRFFEWPEEAGRDRFGIGQAEKREWLDHFGFSRPPARTPKGIAVICLSGVAP